MIERDQGHQVLGAQVSAGRLGGHLGSDVDAVQTFDFIDIGKSFFRYMTEKIIKNNLLRITF